MNHTQVLTAEHNYSFDFVRAIAMLSVILFHAAGAYGFMGAKYWPFNDTQNFLGSAIRELFDVFIMPFFFFIAGYFALPSVRNKTLSGFFINKFNRLYVYWIFVVLILLPIQFYFIFQYDHSNTGYLAYWFNSLLNIKNVSFGPVIRGMYGHMHFWFVSLLFYILMLFSIAYKLGDKFYFKKNISINKSHKDINISNILAFGILTALAYFIFILFFPGSNWVIIPMILQFKTTHLAVLILFFIFGIYSSHKGWFVKNDIPFNITIWIFLSLLFTILFFITGQDFFNNIDISNTLSPLYLFIFSLIRSFLILSYLMLTLLLANKYFSHNTPIITKISDVSFEIYLVHLFFIYAFQFIFIQFILIPVAVKILVVFVLGTITSYFFAKYTIYKFPKISAGVLFILCFVLMAILYR